MIKSMTGYGKALVALPNKSIILELKALNSKYFDFVSRTPSLYKEKEPIMRSLLNNLLERGKIELSLFTENKGADTVVKVNQSAAEAYLKQVYALQANLGLADDPNLLSTLLKMPDVLISPMDDVDEDEWQAIESGLKKAAENLDAFRLAEGEVLLNDFIKRIALIKEYSEAIVQYEEPRIELLRTRFKKNMNSLAEESTFDSNRFEQELIYYIEKLDITEEKVRLARHLDYFIETLDDSDSNGKKLNFIAQEIGREVNTIGSKANDSDIQKLVVMMKDELEKIKEQLSNIL
ncbi:MAG: YicC family protein [Bacteroidales bacterium]|nr:YicC family protein [Bacteroidales bacterium]